MTMDREAILRAADDIGVAFTWKDTPQGHDYWSKVETNLRTLAKDSPNSVLVAKVASSSPNWTK